MAIVKFKKCCTSTGSVELSEKPPQVLQKGMLVLNRAKLDFFCGGVGECYQGRPVRNAITQLPSFSLSLCLRVLTLSTVNVNMRLKF